MERKRKESSQVSEPNKNSTLECYLRDVEFEVIEAPVNNTILYRNQAPEILREVDNLQFDTGVLNQMLIPVYSEDEEVVKQLYYEGNTPNIEKGDNIIATIPKCYSEKVFGNEENKDRVFRYKERDFLDIERAIQLLKLNDKNEIVSRYRSIDYSTYVRPFK